MIDIFQDVQKELKYAEISYPAYHSYHEGYAVIKEEFDELWDEIKKKDPDKQKLKLEAIQVMSTTLRFIKDLLKE